MLSGAQAMPPFDYAMLRIALLRMTWLVRRRSIRDSLLPFFGSYKPLQCKKAVLSCCFRVFHFSSFPLLLFLQLQLEVRVQEQVLALL